MAGLARHLLVAVGVVVALALGTASASAATFCVQAPAGCTGTAEATISDAIGAAQSSAGRDTIQIAGNHTYNESGGLLVMTGNPVDIVGIGSPQPVITDTADFSATLLEIDDTTSTIANVDFAIPSGAADMALAMAGTSASGIHVTGPLSGNSTGIDLVGDGTVLSGSSVVLPFAAQPPGPNGTVGLTVNGDNEVVRDSSFEASTAGRIGLGSSQRLSRLTLTGAVGLEQNGGTDSVLEDSLVLVTGTNGFQPTGLVVDPPGASPETLTARNVSVIDRGGHGSDGAVGVESTTSDGDAKAILRGTIVRGFATVDLLTTTQPNATIDTDYSDWGTSQNLAATPVVRGPHDLNVDPGFVNAAAGDFHLAASSPLIDAGEPGGLQAGESATDFFGADRLAAGRTPCLYARDIGAAEFQPGTPVARASGPATGLTREPLTFSSAGSCGPSANVGIASFVWSFSDGESAAGPTVTHVFTKPGSQTAKLTVTDASGHVASATVALNVTATQASMRRLRLSPPAFRAASRGPSATAKRTGTRVTYRLNEPVTVRFTVKQRRPHSRKLKTLGSFAVHSKAGSNRFHFSGRVRHGKLPPGRYVLVATPGTGAFKGESVTVHFRILR